MKTTRESNLRAECSKTPAFKVGLAPARERLTPSTARKTLDFDFKATSGSESSPASKPKTSRKSLPFGGDSATAMKSNPVTRTPHGTETAPKIAARRNLQRDFASIDEASQKTPQPASKTPNREQRNAAPSTDSISGRTTPKIGMTPSRTLTSRSTPSTTATGSALTAAPNTPKSRRSSLIAAGSRQAVKTTSKEVGTQQTPPKNHITPSTSGSARSTFARAEPPAMKVTPNAIGINATPSKHASTPLNSPGPKNDAAVVEATPKPTPLATPTRLNRLRRSTSSNNAQSSTPKRAQSSCTSSRQCNNKKWAELMALIQISTASRTSPSSSVTESRPTEPRDGTPQGKGILRCTSASTLSSASPEIEPRLNLSRKFIGDSKSEKNPAKQGSDFSACKPISPSNSVLTSTTKPTSRVEAAGSRIRRAKVEVQKQKVTKSDDENNKKWADLMALIRAQKSS